MRPHVRFKQWPRGNAIVEVALLAPFIFFLFVGVLDFGFYSYAIISTQNAARAAALHNSISKAAANGDPDGSACALVLRELKWAPNVRDLAVCTAPPVQAGFKFVPASASADGHDAAQVSVTYQTVTMIPIPNVITNQLTITRTVQMRINPAADK